MSQTCENCGIHIRGFFTYTVPVVRQDEATGYTYRFCSEACANQWVDKRRKHPPTPSKQAASSPSEERRQIEQRWLADGGADRSAQQ